jgi:hypothetical protein
MRSASAAHFALVFPHQVLMEARRNLDADRIGTLEKLLARVPHEQTPMPPPHVVHQNEDLVRSTKDVPIALALLAAGVDIFVTNDRDFTDPGATASRFRERVRPMLPAVFLRDVIGWSSEALEAIRDRTWDDMPRAER